MMSTACAEQGGGTMSGGRQEQILQYMRDGNSFVTVEQLEALLYVSAATVRRELHALEGGGLIRRTRGGALLVAGTADDTPMLLREQQDVDAKQLLAARALRYIGDGMTLFMDSSSTVYYLARRLKGFKNLRVITNGIKTADCLAGIDGITVMCTGGTIRPGTKSAVGASALAYVRALHADAAFLSCRGFVPEKGAYESSEEEYYIKRLFLENSSQTYLLCSKSKVGAAFLYHLAPPEAFDAIIRE
jgi:DeoR/GlpR family transcriptional regulator of sugar metabolism